MEDYLICVLYTKYSKESDFLLQQLPSIQSIKFNLICIDNKIIRDKIVNSKINIQSIPCILIIKKNGEIQIFETEKIAELLNSLSPKPKNENLNEPIPQQQLKKSVIELAQEMQNSRE